MQKFEVRQIDAIQDEPYLWHWNTSYYIGSFATASKYPKRAFLDYLKTNSIRFKKGTIRVVDDLDCLTIEERKTDMPIFIAIPIE